MKRLLGVCLLLLSFSGVLAQGIPFFNIITPTNMAINLIPGETATVTYIVDNRINANITNMQYIPPPLASRSGGTCGATLNQGANCTVVLTVRAPTTLPESGSILLDPLRVCGIGRKLVCSVADRANQIRIKVTITTQLFVTNVNSNTVSVCSANETTGAVINCTDTGVGVPLGQPFSITLNESAARAYIASAASSASTITVCTVVASGALNSCANINNPLFNQPIETTLSLDNSRLFLINDNDDKIIGCDINLADGMLDNCSDAGGSFSDPTSLTFDITGKYAYVTEYGSNSVQNCEVTPNGNLINCTSSNASSLNQPYNMTFNNNQTRAYIANNGNNTVTLCDVSPTRQFSNCNVTLNSGLNIPRNILLDSANTHAYISNRGANYIVVCSIDVSGNLVNCNSNAGNGLFSATMGLYYRMRNSI